MSKRKPKNAPAAPQVQRDQFREDGYFNVLTKYGTQHDSTTQYQYSAGSMVSDAELADLYVGNGLFASIIDAPANDAMRNGFTLGLKDQDIQTKVERHMSALKYQSSFAKALRWSRLFGGALIVMLIDDGRLLESPVNWNDVHGVSELLVYGRNEVTPIWLYGYENRPDSPDYRRGSTGRPDLYQVSSIYGTFRVHASRCLVFANGEIPEGSMASSLYRTWGIPEYLRIRDELQNTVVSNGNAARLLERCSMAIYKMKGLANLTMTEEGDAQVMRRMELIDLGRNILNSVMIDADGEDYDFKNLTLSGVKDIVDSSCTMLSAVSHIPQTRLFGRSPDGMNSTGESDLQNYYDYCGEIQTNDVLDNTRKVVELVFRGMIWNREITEIPDYNLELNSPWSQSDNEQATQDQSKAQTQLLKAQTAAAYVTAGIYEVEEVRRALSGDDAFDPENILDDQDVMEDLGLPPEQKVQIMQEAADYNNSIKPAAQTAPTLATDEGDSGYVAGFVVIDGKLLCARRADGQGYCGPGGHIEPGETPGQALVRETQEEFSITPTATQYLGNAPGLPDQKMAVQIYKVKHFDGMPRADNQEMIGESLYTIDQILAQDVPGGKVFEPFLNSVRIYRADLGG